MMPFTRFVSKLTRQHHNNRTPSAASFLGRPAKTSTINEKDKKVVEISSRKERLSSKVWQACHGRTKDSYAPGGPVPA
jgi:hypothetical protein